MQLSKQDYEGGKRYEKHARIRADCVVAEGMRSADFQATTAGHEVARILPPSLPCCILAWLHGATMYEAM